MKTATAFHPWNRWLLPLLMLPAVGLIVTAPVLLRADEEPESEDQSAPELPSKLESRSLRLKQATSLVQKLTSSDAAFEVIVGQSRTMILEQPLELQEDGDHPDPAIAISDPSIADVMLTGNRQIRILGRRVGVTDLTISTGRGDMVTFQVQVVLDLKLIQARLLQLFPDASIQLAHLGPKLIVEGEARDAQQLARINQVLEKAVQSSVSTAGGSGNVQRNLVDRRDESSGWRTADWQQSPKDRLRIRSASQSAVQEQGQGGEAVDQPQADDTGTAMEEVQINPGRSSGAGRSAGGGAASGSQQVEIINLMRIPGPQQVMLMVQVAELNRTAYRQIGADFLFANSGSILGTRLTGANSGGSAASGMGIFGSGSSAASGGTASTTVFGIFEGPGFQSFVSALRRNSVLKVLAEPNLVAMHGHRADFLAGGEFPVPVPQSGAGGGTPTVTIQYKKFGVQLAFTPYVLDGDLIRMEVDPEVSSIDYSLGTQVSGVSVPGLNTRRSHTTVEMREGQTLAIAGLMQVDLAGRTDRIPGMGDLPWIGPFFSNTTSQRVEKELVVLVTPHLVAAVTCDEVGPLPGAEVYEPNDLEFYLLNRLEGHTGHAEFRSTTNGEDPLGCFHRMQVETRYIRGPHGFSK
ncbi:MAG: type II and III secretion system protein family protein [Planctomycetota bacterium]